ncbi:MAG: CCA tRNA nucleotidyltransferase, partial [Proteobacteria bacterium]|nr:CCA tRNA nucleotidyltransferase [Pseudomonadota bacterium]
AQEEQARALKEAEAKQQAKIQVDEVTAKLRALQLTPPPALPVYLPNEPTTHTITVSEKVKRILTLINARGYYAVIVGGEVRDKLLGLTPHDSDLLTNCPANELREILGHDYRLSINPFNPNKFDIQDENIDILCSSLPLEEELASRDLCVNTFIADRDGKVYDLLKYIHFLRYKELMLIQSKISPDERFQKDPSLMMRLIRLYSHLKKAIPDLSIPRHYVQYLRKTASFLTCQPFGVYLKNVELLFNQGLARDNFNALNFCGMTHHLFPAAAQKCLTCDMRPFILFLHEKLTNIDLLDEQTRKSQHSSYHFLALLLLPEVINQMVLNLTPTHVDAITQTSNFFCNNYLGKFDEPTQTYLGMTEGEKSCFNMNMKIILKSYYEEYLSNYPRYCQIIYQQSMQQDVLAPEGEMAAAASPVTPAYHQTRQRGAQGRRTPKSDSEVAQQEHKCAGTKAAKK